MIHWGSRSNVSVFFQLLVVTVLSFSHLVAFIRVITKVYPIFCWVHSFSGVHSIFCWGYSIFVWVFSIFCWFHSIFRWVYSIFCWSKLLKAVTINFWQLFPNPSWQKSGEMGLESLSSLPLLRSRAGCLGEGSWDARHFRLARIWSIWYHYTGNRKCLDFPCNVCHCV